MKKALVVVDVNNFFLQSAPADFARRIANHIDQSNYDLLAFPVFKNHADSNFVKSLNWSKCSSAEEADLPDELKRFATDKNTFERATYSSFAETDLQKYLQENEIDEVTLAGIDTDACVLATAFS